MITAALLWSAVPTSGFADSQIVYLHRPSRDEAKVLDKFFRSEDIYANFYKIPADKNKDRYDFDLDDVLVGRAYISSRKNPAWIISVASIAFEAQDGQGFDVWEYFNGEWADLGGDYLRDKNYVTILDRRVNGYPVIELPDAGYDLVFKHGQYECEANCPE